MKYERRSSFNGLVMFSSVHKYYLCNIQFGLHHIIHSLNESDKAFCISNDKPWTVNIFTSKESSYNNPTDKFSETFCSLNEDRGTTKRLAPEEISYNQVQQLNFGLGLSLI